MHTKIFYIKTKKKKGHNIVSLFQNYSTTGRNLFYILIKLEYRKLFVYYSIFSQTNLLIADQLFVCFYWYFDEIIKIIFAK